MRTNQKKAKVNKEPTDSKNPYTTINLDALQCAMADLKEKSSFKLWCYFAKNKNGYVFELSSSDLATWGMERHNYYRAFDILVKKGYLVKVEENKYDFYEKAVDVPVEVKVNKYKVEDF